jgi:hypothetical protein
MTRYSKPVWQMVKEAVEKMGEVTAKDVKDYVRKNYAKDNVNELTINAQVIACSVNHSSAHHYPDAQRFLFYLGNGRYRLYDPDKDGIWQMTPSGPQKIGVETKSGEAYFSQVTSGGQVHLPKDILNKLSIKENDFVAFVEDKEANIYLKKAELRIV